MADAREDEVKTISFGRKELDPEQEAAYREKIAAAKKGGISALKGSTPLGHIERPAIPDLTSRQTKDGPTGLTAEGGVAPRPQGSPVLSPQTAAQLEQMQQAQAKEAAAAQAKSGLDEEEIKKASEAVKEDVFDMFDFGGAGEAERILNNKKRRKEIEERCEPMNFEDLILKDEVRQTVPIVPGKFEPRYRTMNPEESLFLKQFLAKDTNTNDAYAVEKFSICQLACCLVSLNGQDFPDHRKPDGTPDEELFKIKMKKLMKKSGYIISDMAINYYWFDIRVRRLIAPERLGNG
jgi:hypothetical protein